MNEKNAGNELERRFKELLLDNPRLSIREIQRRLNDQYGNIASYNGLLKLQKGIKAPACRYVAHS